MDMDHHGEYSRDTSNKESCHWRCKMLSWSIFFLVIALIAALFGFTGAAGAAAGIGKLLFGLFLIVFLASMMFGRRAI